MNTLICYECFDILHDIPICMGCENKIAKKLIFFLNFQKQEFGLLCRSQEERYKYSCNAYRLRTLKKDFLYRFWIFRIVGFQDIIYLKFGGNPGM